MSANQDQPWRLAIVLLRTLEMGVALNAASHMAACLVSRATPDQLQKMSFTDYKDADGQSHPVSALSLVVLQARNSSQIRAARIAAVQEELLHVDFLESMTKDTYIEQMARTFLIPEAELDYWGLALFGPSDVLRSVTHKFSLWR